MSASRKPLQKLAFGLVVFFIGMMMIIPMYIIIKVSFGSPEEILTQHPTLLPHSFTLQHWIDVFQSGNLWQPLKKSLVVATSTMAIAVVVVAPASYAISRLGRRVKYLYVMCLFFTKMFPVVGIALPISITFLKWNLLDSDLGLVLAHLIGQIPFMAWILVSTFSAIPVDLEEAASIDGASRLKALVKIIFPVAGQGISVAALYVWLNSWNEFTFALYLSLTTKTLPLGVYYYVQRGGFFQQAAYSTILAIPVIIITFIMQRYLKSDYLTGAVKG